jgi:hypothetical protein
MAACIAYASDIDVIWSEVESPYPLSGDNNFLDMSFRVWQTRKGTTDSDFNELN